MARMRSTAGTSKQHAEFVEGISSKNLIVAGITNDSKVNNSINQVVFIIVVLPVAMAPEANKVIDTMQDNSKEDSVSNGIVAIGKAQEVKTIESNSWE